MKKVMLTATFLTMTACAGVEESNVPPTGDDMGSDMQPESAGTPMHWDAGVES